uniref:Uncharacterized protein n=1 Tax=Megaselia scalaris TaxID=36166 RepID=T1GFY1_MEGSC
MDTALIIIPSSMLKNKLDSASPLRSIHIVGNLLRFRLQLLLQMFRSIIWLSLMSLSRMPKWLIARNSSYVVGVLFAYLKSMKSVYDDSFVTVIPVIRIVMIPFTLIWILILNTLFIRATLMFLGKDQKFEYLLKC